VEGAVASARQPVAHRMSVEAPSGKHAGSENFPVGSFLIRADLRRHVHTYYRFARTADDIADSPDLAPDEKIRRLDLMGAVLTGESDADVETSRQMRASLAETGVPATTCLDLLIAFRSDATKLRYRDWDDLMEYCRCSANPVGRYLLLLHGESAATLGPSDALCSALQVINHMQDLADDYKTLDRVYLPQDAMAAGNIDVTALAAPTSSTGLRRAIDMTLDRTAALLVEARRLPDLVRDRRMRWESAAIVALAHRLTAMLRMQDPLARRVKLGKLGALITALGGVLGVYGRAA
jgi:hydroxysqualene synthase